MVASQTFPVDLAMISDTLVLYLLSRVSIPRGVWILLVHLGHVPRLVAASLVLYY